MKQLKISLLAAVSALALGASVMADVVSVDEFLGDAFEGFENIGPDGPWSGPMPIFGGAATFDDQFTDPWITFVFGGGGHTFFPYDGAFMGLSPVGWSRFVFTTPVHKFGGYIGAGLQGVDGRARFYDADDSLIASLEFSVPTGEWTWRGWQSDVPIGRVEIDTDINPGVTTVFDNLQASFDPGAPSCPADLTGNGSVGVIDLLELLAVWGPCPDPCPADMTGSGDVGVADLLALLAAWGPCP